MKNPVDVRSVTHNYLFIPVIAIVILLGCAEIKPPPGGPVDKTKPTLVSSIPANGSVKVPIDNRIELVFSEKVMPPPTGKSIFISPRPRKDPKIKWKGDRVIVILPDSFRTDETYIVSVGSAITDLRGNKLDSSGIVAFSTGAFIDSGVVAGQVLKEGAPRAGMMVGLFHAEDITDSTMFDSLYPVYLVQTNSDGRFRFRYLPARKFHLIAFDDNNHDEFFNPLREEFAVSDRLIDIGSDIPLGNLLLSTTSQDTLSPEVLSATYTSNSLVHVRFTHPISTEILKKTPAHIQLMNQRNNAEILSAIDMLETDTTVSAITVNFGKVTPGVYTVSITLDSTKPAITSTDLIVEQKEDKDPPTIVAFSPDTSPVALNRLHLQLTFSEPLDTTRFTDETLVLWDERDNPMPLTRVWKDNFRLGLLSPDIKEGKNYRLTVTEFELADYAGNVVGDSLREYTFSIYDSKSFGAISGSIVVALKSKKNVPVVLHCIKTDNNEIYNVVVRDTTFYIDVPSGKYLLSGFLDSNGDNKRGNGSAIPFRLAETQVQLPDTISVRARFETAGIIMEFR